MRIYPFFIPHAGCPHRCLFCSQEVTTGREAAPTPEEVARTLGTMLPPRGDGEVAFYGGSFTLLPPALRRAYFDAVEPFIGEGRVVGIRLSTRPDALDTETVESLREASVTTVEIGCQSFSSNVLSRSRRGHSPDAAAEAVARLRSTGLGVGLQLMPGLPGADRTEALVSLHRAIALHPDFLRIYPAVVLRGTALEKLWRAGDYHPLELEDAVELCADLLWHCRRAGIPVIRLGLQATAELDGGEALAAGPYHPAFGQLVRSRLWRRALLRIAAGRTGVPEIAVHPSDLADAYGQRRGNLDYLRQSQGPAALVPHLDLPRETLQRDGCRFALQDHCGPKDQTIDDIR